MSVKRFALLAVALLIVVALTLSPAPRVAHAASNCPYYYLTLSGSVSGQTFPTLYGYLVVDTYGIDSNHFDFALVSGNPVTNPHYGNILFVSNTELGLYDTGDYDLADITQPYDETLGYYWKASVDTFYTYKDDNLFSGDGGPFYVQSGDVVMQFSSGANKVTIAADLYGENASYEYDHYSFSGTGVLMNSETNCIVNNY